jgi:hypothetical protein
MMSLPMFQGEGAHPPADARLTPATSRASARDSTSGPSTIMRRASRRISGRRRSASCASARPFRVCPRPPTW